jgi:hypothetical protein
MNKNNPKPLSKHLQPGLNGLLSSVNSIAEAMKGETSLQTVKQRSDTGVMDSTVGMVKPVQGPSSLVAWFNDVLIPCAEQGAALYAEVVASGFTLERTTSAGAERSLRGKLVHAASNTSAAFKEKFGTEARKVEDESFDDNGVKLLKLEGLANPVPHSYVAEPRKEKAAQ